MKTSLQSFTLSRKSFLKALLGRTADTLSPRMGLSRFLESPGSRPAAPLIAALTPVIRLYGATATELGGNAQLDQLKISVNCSDSSTVSWNVTAPNPGEFDLSLSCAVPSSGFVVEVRSGSSLVKANLNVTEGVYRSEEPFYDFERTKLSGRLYLTRGVNPVTMHIAGPDRGKPLRFRCLELVPASASESITSSEERARGHRSNTDWFVEAGYGVLFHWTDFTQPREGLKKRYPEAVDAFDVKAFAELVEEAGAGYVIFTLNHAHPHCPAPIRSWETIHPGWTTRRDLIGEIADALNQHKIKLLLYINSPVMTKLGI